MSGILDTGPLVAFLDSADRFHRWSVDVLSQFDAPMQTCDAVIAEAWHILGRARRGREALLRLLDIGTLVTTFALGAHVKQVVKRMAKYSDVPMSVADACLVQMAEEDRQATIVTIDSDFRVYRRGRAPLRLAMPK